MKSRVTPVGRKRPVGQMPPLTPVSDDLIGLLIGLHVRQRSSMRSQATGGSLAERSPVGACSPIRTEVHKVCANSKAEAGPAS